ncbi:MAG: hypothetical protein ACOY0T_30020 [Myxococcota bacterium]
MAYDPYIPRVGDAGYLAPPEQTQSRITTPDWYAQLLQSQGLPVPDMVTQTYSAPNPANEFIGENKDGGAYDPFRAYNSARNDPNLTPEQRAKLYDMASSGTAQVRNPYDYLIGRDPAYVSEMAAQQQAIGQAAQQGFAGLQAQAGSAQQAGATLQGMGTGAATYGQQAAQGINTGASALGKSSNTLLGTAGSINQRQGPTLDFGMQTGAVGGSMGYADQLANLQQGPSGAQAMLQSGANQSMAQSLALARSGRGWGGSAAGQAQALQQNAATMQQVGNQAAMLRAQEAAQWNAQRAQNLGQAAGIYQGAGTQFGQQTALGAQTQLAQQSANDQYASQLYGLGLQGQQAALGAQAQAAQVGLGGINAGAGIYGTGAALQNQGTALQGQLLGQGASAASQGGLNAFGFNQAQNTTDVNRENMITQDYGIRSGVAIQNQQQEQQLLGSAIGGGATLLGTGLMFLSDERAKKNIRELPDMGRTFAALSGPPATAGVPRRDVDTDALDSYYDPYAIGAAPLRRPQLDQANPYTDLRRAQGYSYEYIDPAAYGDGQFVGPMAQDLEKSPATAGTVYTDENGIKKIDTGRLSLVNTSAIADTQRQIDQLKAMMRSQQGRR